MAIFYKYGEQSFESLPNYRWHNQTATCMHTHLQQLPVQYTIHSLAAQEKFSRWSSMFAFTAQTESTYQMVIQNVFYYH